jgi:hypothetical protein
MPNTLLTISMITNEALYVLRNSLNFTKRVGREYSDKFGVEGAKIGTTLNVRKPPRYIGRTGPALSVENATEESVAVTLNTQFGVDINFTSADLLLSIDQFSKRFIQPGIAAIANKIDYDGLQLYKQVANYVGTAGVVPILLQTYLNAGVKLDDNAAPMDGSRYICVNPLMQATIVNALTGLFHSGGEIKRQYEKGTMGQAAGFEWAMDQNCPSHTVGAIAGAGVATVTGAGQTGSSILTGSWTANSALKKGDIITFAAVYGVNPQNRQSTGALQQFVVTADTADNGAGVMTIPISPAITVTGAFQTVTNSPGAGALISVFGLAAASFSGVAGLTFREGMAFHKDAFTLATADLPLPNGVDMAARAADPDLGISIRLIRAYDINTDKFPCRLDVLYGWAALRPELACRIGS